MERYQPPGTRPKRKASEPPSGTAEEGAAVGKKPLQDLPSDDDDEEMGLYHLSEDESSLSSTSSSSSSSTSSSSSSSSDEGDNDDVSSVPATKAFSDISEPDVLESDSEFQIAIPDAERSFADEPERRVIFTDDSEVQVVGIRTRQAGPSQWGLSNKEKLEEGLRKGAEMSAERSKNAAEPRNDFEVPERVKEHEVLLDERGKQNIPMCRGEPKAIAKLMQSNGMVRKVITY